jgi:hypothetical protein
MSFNGISIRRTFIFVPQLRPALPLWRPAGRLFHHLPAMQASHRAPAIRAIATIPTPSAAKVELATEA